MLLAATIAFLIGLTLGSYLPYLPLCLFAVLLLTAVALTAWEQQAFPHGRRGLVLYGSLLAGILLWTFSAAQTEGNRLTRWASSEPTRIEATVVAPPRHSPSRSVMTIAVSQVEHGGQTESASGRARLSWRSPDRVFARGDRISFRARLREPSGTVNPGGFDYAAYLGRRHVLALASVSGPGKVVLLRSGRSDPRWVVWHLIDSWRERIRQAALKSLDQPALGFYLGIITGERGLLSSELRDRFMATGTVHILSISGSHLGLVGFLSFFLVRETCRRIPAPWLLFLSRWTTPSRLAAVATAAPVTFYALLAGAEVATVRALLMIYVFLLAVWLGYSKNLLHALAVSAVVILAHEPQALLDISFQLSFSAVLAIALVLRWQDRGEDLEARPSEPVRHKATRWLRDYALITGGVTLATIPLVAYHFNQIAWLGLFANLIVVPIAGFVLVPLGLLSAVLVLVTGADTLPLGEVNQALLDLTAGIVAVLSRLPGAEWHVASPAVPAIVLFYALLIWSAKPGVEPHGFTAVAPMRASTFAKATVDKSAGSRGFLRRRVKPALRYSAILGTMLMLCWWAWSPRLTTASDTLRVTFLDVGQGDASVLELPNGQTVLIDAGAAFERLDMGRAVVAPYLWDRGIRHLDLVVATHPQLDHVGGLPWILRKFAVDRYAGNGIERNRTFYTRLRRTIADRSLHEERATDGDVLLTSPGCRLTTLNPPVVPRGEPRALQHQPSGSLLNNLSVVTRLECGAHSILFAADIEAEAMERMRADGVPLHARVLKVPHHGARSSLSWEWIREVSPEAAIISVGRRNPYHHPAPAVLQAYAQVGSGVWRTDLDGAVSLEARLSAREFTIRSARLSRPRTQRLWSLAWEQELDNLDRIWRHWLNS